MRHAALLPGVAVDDVLALMGDPATLEAFAAEVGVDVQELRTERTGAGATRVAMVWSFRTSGFDLPSWTSRLLPATIVLDWRQTWSAAGAGGLDVVMQGQPQARFQGTCTLAGRRDGVTYTVDGTTRTSLPWPMGGKAAGMIDQRLIAAVLDDHATVLRSRVAAGAPSA